MWSFKKEIKKLSTVGAPAILPCGSLFTYSGTLGIFFVDVEIGTAVGLVELDYEAFSIPDRFQIKHGAIIVADSYYVGDNLSGNPPNYGGMVGTTYPNIPEKYWDGNTFILNGNTPDELILQGDVAPVGATSGTGTISFIKVAPTPTTITLIVSAPLANTAWNMTPKCPVPLPQASFTQVDFQEEGDGGCVSCATLTVTVPAGTNKRVEFVKTGDTNGVYSVGLGLCSGSGTELSADLTEVITATKTYKFGIDAVKSTTNNFSNTITAKVYDDDTNALEDTYIHTRTHTNVNC